MKNAVIIYHSKTGTTKKYARELSLALQSKGITISEFSIAQYKPETVLNADIVLLGCWTSGLFFFLQKPEKTWVEFAKELSILKSQKLAFFTTFKVRTGSMFRNMKKHIGSENAMLAPELKSKNGKITSSDEKILSELMLLN
jgi:flavodoxin